MEWIESILSTMVSLQVFEIDLDIIDRPAEEYFSLIMRASTHLQYFTLYDCKSGSHCWKQLRGEWIVCDETECP
jgi:hypothetical protein